MNKIVELLNKTIELIAADVRVIRSSGYGTLKYTCVGIIGEKSDCMRVICEVIKSEALDLTSDKKSNFINFQQLVNSLLEFSEGKAQSGVILYWPNLPWEEEFNDN